MSISEPADRSPYRGYRFPPEIIAHAVWLYFRFHLSFRDVQDLLAERGVVVSHETIRQWCTKFGTSFAAGLRRRRVRAGDKWHLDEVALKIHGKRHWLWRAVDQHGVVLDILVQDRRDQVAAERFLHRVLDAEDGAEPRVVITDKLASYPPAIRRALPKSEHRRHKGLNNRAENSHLPTRKRERILQRFKSAEHAQRFLVPFSAVSIALFDAMKVIGRRPGKYRDPDTREVIDLTSNDALIRITGRRDPAQLALDDSAPPLEVSYVAGPWIEQWKGNHQVLTYFGDVRKLASIPARRPSGAWAQAIGLALQQCWRERSADADVARVGEQSALTVRVKQFTRHELLDMFPPSPTVDDVLNGPHPKRAQSYWHEAITQLKRAKVVGFYKEAEQSLEKRQGWADAWLDQALDIRPTEDGRLAIAQIAGRARQVRRPRRAPASVGRAL